MRHFFIAALISLLAGVAAPSAFGYANGASLPRSSAPWVAHDTCSGVLVAPTRVLTAAHCHNGGAATFVVIGHAPGAEENIPVAGVTVDPHFTNAINPHRPSDARARAGRHDIAILTLARPARATPLRLAGSVPRVGTRAIAYGFGIGTGRLGEQSWHRATLGVAKDATCKRAFPEGTLDTKTTLCVEDRGDAPKQRICGGDSGGPLVARGRLIGLATYGPEVLGADCGHGPALMGFADVRALRAFATQPTPPFLPVVSAGALTSRTENSLTCTPPTLTGGTARVTQTTVSWERRDLRKAHGGFAYHAIEGARNASYAIRPADTGTQIRCLTQQRTTAGPIAGESRPLHIG